MVEAYPLHWPESWKRNDKRKRASQFRNSSVSAEIYELMQELRMFNAKNIVVSSNLMTKLDGLPRSGQRQPDDPAVAVYFILNEEEQCFPCDRWDKVEHNIRAIFKTIKALRGIERWGAKDMVNAAFRGFKALPSPDMVMVNHTQHFTGFQSKLDAKTRYRELAKELHPDNGGDAVLFSEMNRQYNKLQ